jgi:Spy/CpxP family protein refolding chaperone
MADMKSALEIAMEKLQGRQEHEAVASLTDVQRQQISDLRKQYDAKIAEKEIMTQSEIRQLLQRRPPNEVAAAAQELQEKLQQAKKALQEELEAKLAAIRAQP